MGLAAPVLLRFYQLPLHRRHPALGDARLVPASRLSARRTNRLSSTSTTAMRSTIYLSILAFLASLAAQAAPVAVDELDVVSALETSQENGASRPPFLERRS